MTRTVVYSPSALVDLEAAASWLTQSGAGPSAHRRLLAIWSDLERLREAPCLYPVIDLPGVRELSCGSGYRALYEVENDTGDNATAGNVVILRIYGPGQDRRSGI